MLLVCSRLNEEGTIGFFSYFEWMILHFTFLHEMLSEILMEVMMNFC